MAEKTLDCIVDDLISMLSKTKESLQTKLAQLEEEYRKMLEEAEKTLKEQLEETNTQYDYWVAARDNTPVPVKKPRRKRKEKEEVPTSPEELTKVMDTIYPENNETPEEDQGPEFDGAGFTDADNEAPKQSAGKSVSLEDLFSGSGDVEPTPEETAEEPETEEFLEDMNDAIAEEEPKPMDFDDWEEPEEWK